MRDHSFACLESRHWLPYIVLLDQLSGRSRKQGRHRHFQSSSAATYSKDRKMEKVQSMTVEELIPANTAKSPHLII